MKKIIFGTLMMFGSFALAQNYPDYYPSNNSNNNGYYSDNDDRSYFPDDYYYDYPSDYYTDDYYNANYNDYRRSISNVNWERFFVENRISPYQVREIARLNQMYSSFSTWDNYYRYNPDRWYYDRFSALENILGTAIFAIFENVYYGGYNPVVYYRNYRINHYRPAIYVVPRYRNVNINVYRVDRYNYHQNNGWSNNNYRQNNGFQNSNRNGGNGSWNNNNTINRSYDSSRPSEGFRGEAAKRNDNGNFGNSSQRRSAPVESARPQNNNSRSENQGGFRGGSPRQNNGGGNGRMQQQSQERRSSSPSNNSGFRGSQKFVSR